LESHNYILLDLPSKVEYALLALLEMACQPNPHSPLTVSEITSKQPIPERYLEQILATLRRGGLLKSQRGAKGGYLLTKEANQITLLDVVSLIEGEKQVSLDSASSTIEIQLIREDWQKANLAAQSVLAKYSLADLCKQREAYSKNTLMYYI
jgi:Rrf2 family protein